ncbi:uncharacterized protein LOC106462707 isoform X2 [Limulus polyphemus]|nr:uncharacterized protein LOC106462707 isoform X2 [Limulus polyphemus]XP_022245740.1 uncharacterized protein LOC106462707 isoform X2 [Limulus polyphemus]XP_022245741.1 uncharacterized protein LOC106462707 isoform X2 [Limulus polyphemus]
MPSDHTLPSHNTLGHFAGFHDNSDKLTMRTLKSGISHRIPSPDSACEQDWTSTAPESILSERKSTTDDSNSDISDSGNLMAINSTSYKGKLLSNMQHNTEKPGFNSGFHPQDSDGDSGIVAVGWRKDRVGSICSTEIDDGQHQFQKNRSQSRPTSLSTMHSISLKDLSNTRVRFHEDLYLTEHNIRRSCRKLLETFYAQKCGATKFGHSNSNRSSSSVETMNQLRDKSVVVGTHQHELNSVKQALTPKTVWSTFKESSNNPVDNKQNRYYQRQHLNIPPSVTRYNKNLTKDTRLPNRDIYTGLTKYDQLKNLGPRLARTNTEDNEQQSSELILARTNKINDQEKRTGLTLVRTNTKDDVQRRFHHKNSTKNLKILCTVAQNSDFDCSKTSTNSNWNPYPFKTSLFKSRSCATLPSESIRTTGFPFSESLPYQSQDQLEFSHPNHGRLVSTEKNPSFNTLVAKKKHSNCDLRGDDMIRAYARLVSVIPERLIVQEETIATDVESKAKKNLTTDSRSSRISEYADYAQVLSEAENSEGQTNTCFHSKNNSIPNSSAHKSSFTTGTNDDTLKKYLPTKKTSGLLVGVRPKNKTGTENNNTLISAESSLPKDQALSAIKTEEVPDYAVIDKSKKAHRPSLPRVVSNPCIINASSGAICEQQQPPVPPKKFLHSSDFVLYKSSATSGKSILERMQGFTKSARGVLQRAFSTERVYKPEKEDTVHKLRRSQSFFKGLKNRMSMRNNKRKTNNQNKKQHSISTLEALDRNREFPPDHVWGQLIQLHLDGSQEVEINKPNGKPFGFFVARGSIKNYRGVFVSRMRDYETQKLLSGLIDIGDEILEIGGINVREKDIIEVNSLMAKKNNLTLTVLPYKNRQDV